ncbi:MAG: adenylosuccinate synthase [Halobacteriovorax sp.]|nr:adenylosuccinate synthase [Halobacteriovorax sp.]
MKTLAIIGSQWGDEGKGKITDLLAAKCDLVVRYQGGNNAGHTIIVEGKKTVLHLIPSGILHPHCMSLVGHGVVFDPRAFSQELKTVTDAGAKITPENLRLSRGASVITTYHRILDGVREAQGPIKIGTTGKGIGPAYVDKVARRGLKLGDLTNLDVIKAKLKTSLQEKESLFKNLYQAEYPSVDQEANELFEFGKKLAPFLDDTFALIDKALMAGKKVMYEGAQGVLLDIDWGSYPFVTSSSTSAGGIYTGAGCPGSSVEEVLGITKAYTTRVGEGPFPTELFEHIGEDIQTKGGEFGATTGRKRRCGWLDLPLLKYSVKASNLTSIALTKVDVLANMGKLKVCVAYEIDGKQYDMASPGLDLSKVKPVYEEVSGFEDDFTGDTLSSSLKSYIEKIEKHVGIPVGILAFGPERHQIKFIKDYF